MERAADLETLWAAMDEEAFGDDERLPYWTELWPASLVLGEWLHEQQATIAGKTCLDMGCGLGLTAMVASSLGARVVAMDYEPMALHFAARNAEHNAVPQPLWTVMDWRYPAVAAKTFDVLWGGDIMYERRFVEPVMQFLEYALKPDGVAWVAEPNRNVYNHFLSILDRRGWKAHRVAMRETAALYDQPAAVTVSLWELHR